MHAMRVLWACDDDRTILSSINYVHLPIEDFLKEEEMFFLNKFKICSPFPSFCLYLSKKWLTISRRDMFPVTSQDLLGFSWGQSWQMLAAYCYPLLAQYWHRLLSGGSQSLLTSQEAVEAVRLLMNGESDLRYSNKRQLEAEEDSGTNSDLTEKHSSDVRQIPMVRNTSRYFLCFLKLKSASRPRELTILSQIQGYFNETYEKHWKGTWKYC